MRSMSTKKYWHLSLLLCCLLAVIFSLPDLYVDFKTGNFFDPIRTFQANNAHYLTVTKAAWQTDSPVPNSYLHEQQAVPSHYALWQSIFAHLPFVSNISIAWLWTILRILVAISYFILLAIMMKQVGCHFVLAQATAFSVVCVFGFIRFQSMALGNWYIPPMLLGIYLSQMAFVSKEYSIFKRFLFLVISLILFSWHSVSFSIGGLAIFIIWLFLIFRSKSEDRRLFIIAMLAWLSLSLIIFLILYAPFMSSHSQIGLDTLSRVVQFRSTRFIYHPIETAILVVAAVIFWQSRAFAYLAFSLAPIIGLNSNLLTGFYFANDHYQILNEALIFIALVHLWFWPKEKISRFVWLAIVAILFGGLYLYSGYAGHLGYRIAFIGRYLVIPLSLFAIACLIIDRTSFCRTWLVKFWRPLSGLMIVLSLVYVSLLIYKGTAYELEKQTKAKRYVPLIEYLRQNNYAVVLANSTIASYIPLYTQDKIYWLDILWTDIITEEEILERWLVSRAFFPNDDMANGMLAVDSVYGAEIRCRHNQLFVKPLFGFLANTWLANWRGRDCPIIEQERREQLLSLEKMSEQYNEHLVKEKLKPKYRLDLLVVDKNDQTSENILKRDFRFLKQVGDFSIYSYEK